MNDIEIVKNAIIQLEVVFVSGMDKDMIDSNKEIAKMQLQRIVGSQTIKNAKKYLEENLEHLKWFKSLERYNPDNSKCRDLISYKHFDKSSGLLTENEILTLYKLYK